MRPRHVLAVAVGAALVAATPAWGAPPGGKAELSGVADMRGESSGHGLTECPQAGSPRDHQPQPLDRREKDRAEQVSNGGDDVRVNQDYACFPQDETSIAVNPLNPRNAVAGANDYRLGWATSGFFATTNNGNHWHDGLIPFPSLPSGDNLDGGGDPAIVFDRSGVVFYADINFNRTDDTNGIFVSRSSNGGFTWSRPCVPIPGNPDPDANARCGGPGDPRQAGDGAVSFNQDPDQQPNFSVPFDDKEYIAAGRRPAGFDARCFEPVSRSPRACEPGEAGPDRVYVTWTRFDPDGSAKIMLSYSDDRGRSWSSPRSISGSAPFCVGRTAPTLCDLNQFSTPTVSPATGFLYVAFENFNTPNENQYLMVRSRDGGQTFEGPFFITPVFDVNYPRAGAAGGRPDCTARGQQSGRAVLTNSCFRVNSGGNIVADRRGGEHADDLYLVMSDNRNGTRASSNTDVFLFRSKDGGSTWIGPTRVNDDPSRQPENRDCGRTGQPPCPPDQVFGNDQWFPWVDISESGDLVVSFYDRRLDTASTASEWPTSRQRPGNYLVWRFSAHCQVTRADSGECLGDEAAPIPQPTEPINPSGPQPGGAQTRFPLRNATLSDTPSNWDYSFRAGIFAGDYDVVAIGPDSTAWAAWTDARNGRSSRSQPGRNPACEQSDAFVDLFSARSAGTVGDARATDALFLVTPCPTDMQDR